MSVVGDGIRSSFVLRRANAPSSASCSSSSPAAAYANDSKGGRCREMRKEAARGGVAAALDVKCPAQREGRVVPIAERQTLSASVVKEEERIAKNDDELVPRNPPSGTSAVEIAAAAHQLEISLQRMRLLPTELLPEIVVREAGVADYLIGTAGPSPVASSSGKEEETSDLTSTDTLPSQLRPKKVWQGVRRRRRMPTQTPWSADDFTIRAELLLQSILVESSEGGRSFVEEVLNAWLGKITRVELTRLVKDLGFQRQPSLALDVFFWMQKQKGRLKPSKHVYSTVIGMLGRAGMATEARQIFDSEQVRSFQSVHIYNSMMGAYVKCGNFERAWKLYEDLCAHRLQGDEVTFNTLLSGISRADMPLKSAESLFLKMKRVGIEPDRYTYNTLITAFSKCGHLQGAAALLDEMRGANQTPDLCTYNIVIGMYGRAGKYEKALEVYDILKGEGLYPDVVTFTYLIQMLSRAHNLDAAISQISEMQRVGCTPDLMIFSLVVHIYGRAGLEVEAEQAFKRMQEAGFVPNIVTWSSLIQAYGSKGMIAKVGSCFSEMVKSGCQPDASLYNIMMTAFRQAQLPIHAASLFRRMQSQGIEPNAACFNTLIHAFSESGYREDAKAWYEQMVRSGFTPDKLSRRLLNNRSPRRGQHRDTRRSRRPPSICLMVSVPHVLKK